MSVSVGGEKTFKRGIHPPHYKHYSESVPISNFVPTGELTLSTIQHIGAPCELKVKARQEIALFDLLADSQAFISAPIHATINGTTGSVGYASIAGGRRVTAITIKPAEENAIPEDFMSDYLRRDWDGVEPTSYDADQVVQAIRDAGIVGLGGATFPTYVKLKRDDKRPVDTIILNGCECEPYLTADHRLMLETPESIVTGFHIAMHACGAKKAIIAIESNKPDAIEEMRKACAGRAGMEVAVCASTYPMGGERQLIPAVTGRTVPSAPVGLPLDVGVVVVNVATCHSIARAVVHGKPLTHRVVSVTGGGITKPANVLAPVGTSLQELIEHCGGVNEKAHKVVAGGPMMGPALPNLNVAMVKGTGGITVMTREETPELIESPCIRCGRCIDNCPLFLSPTKIAHSIKAREYEVGAEYDMMACCECGCCAYVCPAQIPLTQYIRTGKMQWRAIAAAKKN